MTTEFKPCSRVKDLIIQEFEEEVLVYDLIIQKAYCLNKTSAIVWQECDGTKSIKQIARHISSKLNSPISEDFVWLAVYGLKKENLLEKIDFPNIFNGVPRREAIKKIGLSSMVALPIVSSMIAPTVIMAASGICTNPALGAPCTTNAECQARFGDTVSVCTNNCCLAGGGIPGGTPTMGPFGPLF